MTGPSLSLVTVARRLTGQVRNTARVGEQTIRYRNCTVSAVTTGAAADGSTAVFIQNGSDTIPAPYLGSAPAVGNTVAVMFANGSPLILGKVNGPPAL